jgi:3-oxoacyl-[acyl-carrier-protein] synthase-1
MSESWWATLKGQRVPAEREARPALPLRIESAGLCCAVGYHLRAAACAIRTNMDHFQESEFVSDTGKPINVGRLPDKDCWGSERVARWIAWSVRDCLRDHADFDAGRVALVVVGPEPERPDVEDESYWEIVTAAMVQLGMRFHESSRILPLGKAGLAQALQYAAVRLATPEIDGVILAAGDSLLNVAAIEHFLAEERLLVPGNRDGFMPAEGAAALLLRRTTKNEAGVRVTGFGEATETGQRDGETPNRALGLTEAVRGACTLAGIAPHILAFRLSDQNGEAYLSKEGSNAFTRVMAGGPGLAHLTLADKLGEIGAAAGVAGLAYLRHVMPRADCSPGSAGVVHLSNDNGLRCAVVVQHHAS